MSVRCEAFSNPQKSDANRFKFNYANNKPIDVAFCCHVLCSFFLHVKRWACYTVKGGELQKALGGLRETFVKLFDYLRALCNCMLCFLFFSYKIDYKTRLWLRLYKWSSSIHQISVQSMPSSWNCKMSIFFCFKIILMKICVC